MTNLDNMLVNSEILMEFCGIKNKSLNFYTQNV